mgnify:CR=1 FL=1
MITRIRKYLTCLEGGTMTAIGWDNRTRLMSWLTTSSENIKDFEHDVRTRLETRLGFQEWTSSQTKKNTKDLEEQMQKRHVHHPALLPIGVEALWLGC